MADDGVLAVLHSTKAPRAHEGRLPLLKSRRHMQAPSAPRWQTPPCHSLRTRACPCLRARRSWSARSEFRWHSVCLRWQTPPCHRLCPRACPCLRARCILSAPSEIKLAQPRQHIASSLADTSALQAVHTRLPLPVRPLPCQRAQSQGCTVPEGQPKQSFVLQCPHARLQVPMPTLHYALRGVHGVHKRVRATPVSSWLQLDTAKPGAESPTMCPHAHPQPPCVLDARLTQRDQLTSTLLNSMQADCADPPRYQEAPAMH